MRPLTAPRNAAPVPLAPRRTAGWSIPGLPWTHRTDAVRQMDAMADNGTVFGIVDRLSAAVAKTEWKLYRKAASGSDEDRTEVTSHAALDLISRPNPFFSRMRLFETGQQHHELTGETWFVVGRDERMRNLPLELWPVRPDRMTPVPHSKNFLAGYIYTSPDGEQVPLELDEVVCHLRPHPKNAYRGIGPIQAVLTSIHSAHAADEWNKNFFLNSAEPGGIIEVPRQLNDEDFTRLRMRWNEQHRGVSKAHRVAILEEAEWKDRKYTQRDMEFTQLRGVTRDQVLEAFGYPKSMLGITEDVNRANAEAGEVMFSRWLVVPRLDRWRDTLNTIVLPFYGKDAARTLEFDYESPVPADRAADTAELTAKANAAQAYIAAGYDGESVVEALELPKALVWEKPTPPPAPTPPTPAAEPAPAPAAPEPAPAAPAARLRIRNSPLGTPPDDWPEFDLDAVDAIDLGPTQSAWEKALAALLRLWRSTVVADWIGQLIDAIRAALRGDGQGLAELQIHSTDAATRLAEAMAGLAETAAGHVVREAAGQGVTLTPVWPSQADLAEAARQTAALEAARYALSAGREAARVAGPTPDVDDVAERVRAHLEELADAATEAALGGALTAAQNDARARTLRAGPDGALYASEQMDRNTCARCREIHGRWIANTSDLTALHKLYPAGGYIDCLGRWRCRGTVVGVWRPQQVKEGQ